MTHTVSLKLQCSYCQLKHMEVSLLSKSKWPADLVIHLSWEIVDHSIWSRKNSIFFYVCHSLNYVLCDAGLVVILRLLNVVCPRVQWRCSMSTVFMKFYTSIWDSLRKSFPNFTNSSPIIPLVVYVFSLLVLPVPTLNFTSRRKKT